MKNRRLIIFSVVCMIVMIPLSSRASLSLQDFTEKMSVKGDLRVRYENKEKDLPDENKTDRMRQRFRLGFSFDTTENFKIAAGLTTGGPDATSANDTYSDESFFETGDIRLDYAYAEHRIMDMAKIVAGQQKNPFKSSWALWDGDVRPVGFTAEIDLKPVFITAGWYDVYYADHNMSQMEAIQAGAKTDMFTGALAVYNYHDDSNAFLDQIVGGDSSYMDEDYKYQIVDLYGDATVKVDNIKIVPHAQFFMNIGAKGDEGQGVLGGEIDPEQENFGYLIGVNGSIYKFSGTLEYASIGADSCVPLLKDGDFGDALDSVDVQGFKIGCGYKVTSHCSLGLTAYLYQAKERDNDQDPRTFHFDLKYKF